MELLPEQNDPQFFVPEILAMLDFDDITWPVTLMEEEPLVELKPIKLLPLTDAESKLKKRKKPATPRLRNKAKIELLRQEVETLEAEVEALQRSKQMAAILQETHNCHVEPVWKTIALRQNQERERAMRCNEKLKRMLHEQQMLTMSLSSVLSEWRTCPSAVAVNPTELD